MGARADLQPNRIGADASQARDAWSGSTFGSCFKSSGPTDADPVPLRYPSGLALAIWKSQLAMDRSHGAALPNKALNWAGARGPDLQSHGRASIVAGRMAPAHCGCVARL